MMVMTRENEKLVAMPRRKMSPKAKEINIDGETRDAPNRNVRPANTISQGRTLRVASMLKTRTRRPRRKKIRAASFVLFVCWEKVCLLCVDFIDCVSLIFSKTLSRKMDARRRSRLSLSLSL